MSDQSIFQLLEKEEFYEVVRRSDCLREGHLVFRDLHHEFYLNPSTLFLAEAAVTEKIIRRLTEAIAGPIDFVLVPERSEASRFTPALIDRLSPTPQSLTLIYNSGFPLSSTATPYIISEEIASSVRGKSVLFVDSGTVTGESVTCVRDGLVRAESGIIHVFTFFHRKDTVWAENLTGLTARGIPVMYYYLGRLSVPVWRLRDCPWEKEADYWRNRSRKYHSKRSQLAIRTQLSALIPVYTSRINWEIDQAISSPTHHQQHLPLNVIAPAPPRAKEETSLKFRLTNEFFHTGDLSKVIMEEISAANAQSVRGAVALVATAWRAFDHQYPIEQLTQDAERRTLTACRRVMLARSASPRDKWCALQLMRKLLRESFADELPHILDHVQHDDSLYLAVVDAIHSYLEDDYKEADSVREAFNIARFRLDRELRETDSGSEKRADFRLRTSLLYDIRQDQYSLLPTGRNEYPLSNVLLPLRGYITPRRPEHTPVALSINRILKHLSDYLVSFESPRISAGNLPKLPVRLVSLLETWKDDVYEPALNVYSLLKRLYEVPYQNAPEYLDEFKLPNMYSDIETSHVSVSRLIRFHNSSSGQRVSLSEFDAEVSRLYETLKRIVHGTFEENTGIWEQVQAWFVPLRERLEEYSKQYEDVLRKERQIILQTHWSSRIGSVIWYHDHFKHAFDNFFNDALKEDSGPFPNHHEGKREIRISVSDVPDEMVVEITWQDTGVGITDATLLELDDIGRDLTLCSVKRRLRRVGGDIAAERRDSGGTMFRIRVMGADA